MTGRETGNRFHHENSLPQTITGALELLRVQDAQAALPQNCSPKKIKWAGSRAYSTSVPYPPKGCSLPILLKIRNFFRSRLDRLVRFI